MGRRTKTLIAALFLTPFLQAARFPLAQRATSVASSDVQQQLGISLQWVIHAGDVVACETPAPDFRTLRHEYRDRIAITTYVVAGDTALVRSFLRNERLTNVTVLPIGEREFQRRFASHLARPAVTPMVVLSRPGAAPGAYYADVRTAAGRSSIEALAAQVVAYFHAHDDSRVALTRREEGGRQ